MQSKRQKAIQIKLKTIENYYVNKTGSLNDREQAVMELKKKYGIDVRSDGNTDGDVLRRLRRLKLEANNEQRPFHFSHKGQLYKTDVNETDQFIKVTKTETKNGNHTDGKSVVFRGKNADEIAKKGGGYFTDKVVSQIDKMGKLP